MLNFQGAVHQDSVLLTHAPPLGWVSFPRKTWVSFNYKSIPNAENAVFVSLVCDNVDDNMGFFVYTSGNKTYIEMPYQGIWEAPPALHFGATTGTFED